MSLVTRLRGRWPACIRSWWRWASGAFSEVGLASWGDTLEMTRPRQPTVSAQMVAALNERARGFLLEAFTECRASLTARGFDPPVWSTLARIRPAGFPPEEMESSNHRVVWQLQRLKGTFERRPRQNGL